MKIGRVILIRFAAPLLLVGAWGCTHEKPNFIYMPDMHHNPSYKAQEEGSMRTPPAGTVARGHSPYPFSVEEVEAASRQRNPLPRTKANFMRGQDRYNTYCIVCHGPAGEGDGFIVPKFPRPPSLQSDKVRDYSDGRIFHIVTMGQNLMPSYARQIPISDRWAIVHYLRALYRAKHPTAADLRKLEAAQ